MREVVCDRIWHVGESGRINVGYQGIAQCSKDKQPQILPRREEESRDSVASLLLIIFNVRGTRPLSAVISTILTHHLDSYCC